MSDERREAALEAAAEDLCGGEAEGRKAQRDGREWDLRWLEQLRLDQDENAIALASPGAVIAADGPLLAKDEVVRVIPKAQHDRLLSAFGAARLDAEAQRREVARLRESTHPDPGRSAEQPHFVVNEPGAQFDPSPPAEQGEREEPIERLPNAPSIRGGGVMRHRSAEHPETGERERIVLWACARCDRVERLRDGDQRPECCGKHVNLGERSEQEHEPTLMLAVSYVRESTIAYVASTLAEPLQDGGEREARHFDSREDAILAAWRRTTPVERSGSYLAFRAGYCARHPHQDVVTSEQIERAAIALSGEFEVGALKSFSLDKPSYAKSELRRACQAILTAAPTPEVERLREEIASALTSLDTGPLKDGYAASILRDALTKSGLGDEGGER